MTRAVSSPARRPDAGSLPAAIAGPAAGARLLAIAGSGAWTSVALLRDECGMLECDSIAEPAGADQSVRLLATIGEVLGPAGIAAVSAIAFDAGPGAFTGLRIGCSVAQGLGFARALPLIAVGSLEAAAWRSLRLVEPGADVLVRVANDARMDEVYASVVRVRAPLTDAAGPQIDALVEPMLAAPGSLPVALSRDAVVASRPELVGLPWLAAGDAWSRLDMAESWFDALSGRAPSSTGATGVPIEAKPDARAFAASFALPGDARAVAEVGWTLWQQGRAVAADDAAPRYVRDKVALEVDEQRALRAQREAGR